MNGKFFAIVAVLLLVGCGAQEQPKEDQAVHNAPPPEPVIEKEIATAPLDEVFYNKALEVFRENQYIKAGTFLLCAIELGNQDALNQFDQLVRTHREYRELEPHWTVWLERVARRGLLIAQLDLAKRHLIGDGVNRNIARGYAWYLLAKESGVEMPDWAVEEWTGIDDALSEADRRTAMSMKRELAEEGIPTRLALNRLSLLLASAPELPLLTVRASEIPTIDTLLINEKAVRNLPEKFVQGMKVRRLGLTDTSIEELPDSIGEMHSLRTLVVFNSPLKSIPPSIGNLRDLEYLALNRTMIEEIPTDIRFMSRLATLDLSENRIKLLPSELWSLPELSVINVSNNQLKDLPKDLIKSNSLQRIYINGNPLDIDRALLEELSGKTDIVADDGTMSKGIFHAQLLPPMERPDFSLLGTQ